MLQISNNINYIRELSKKSQLQFAKIFDVTDKNGEYSKDKIYNYETGKTTPPDIFIRRICEYAGISEDQLLNDDLRKENIKINDNYKVDQEPSTSQFSEPVANPYAPDLTQQAILKLATANELLAQSNKKLADNSERLINMVEATAHAGKNIPTTFDTRFGELLVTIAQLASGEMKFESSEEAFASLSKRFYAQPQKVT